MSYARRHSINVCPGNRVRYSGDGIWTGGGTSAACAAVSGAIGLLLTAVPDETQGQIRARLESGARQIDPYQPDPNGEWIDDEHSGYYGHGLLDVFRSLQSGSRTNPIGHEENAAYTGPRTRTGGESTGDTPGGTGEDTMANMKDDTKMKLAAAIYGDFVTNSDVKNADEDNHGYKPNFSLVTHGDWIDSLFSGDDGKIEAALDHVEITEPGEQNKVKVALVKDTDLDIAAAIYRKLKEDHVELKGKAGHHDY